MAAKASASVRMYRLDELGDCFLVTFKAARRTSRMLIDCGSFRNNEKSIARLKAIVGSIKKELRGKKLDVVVGTHQHNDHVSGFVHCENELRAIGVEQVWLSWLDDPADRLARDIGADHNNLVMALFRARSRIRAPGLGARGARALEVLDDLLGFYGAVGDKVPPELPANAIAILRKLGRREPRYLRPGQVLDVPRLPAGSVRAYVLGPPRKIDLLYRKDPRRGESFDHSIAYQGAVARRFLDAVEHHATGSMGDEEEQYPFARIHKRMGEALRQPGPLKHLLAFYEKEPWRKIDDDWLSQAESLALYLDTFTNNSSLVLAIELVESRKVLLFAADAQTGNWLSWSDVEWERPGVSTQDLLARTVLYKVGHHASHNATLVQAFEQMTNPALSALIPVHKQDPNIKKPNGWKMPARNLFKALAARMSNRVLQMDGVNPAHCDPHLEPAKSAWKQAGINPETTDLFIELEIRG